MAKNSNTTAQQARQIWNANVAPFAVAAREGASRAAETARQERARMLRRRPWWRSRTAAVAAAGLAVAAAAGAAAVTASRRPSSTEEPTTEPPATSNGGGQLRSTVDAGRARVGHLTRHVLHRVRRAENGATAEPAGVVPEPAGVATLTAVDEQPGPKPRTAPATRAGREKSHNAG